MPTNRIAALVGILALAGLSACSGNKDQAVSFSKDVKPMLDKNCAECHMPNGQGAVASGLLMDSYENLMKGTTHGPVIVAGHAASSSLYLMVAGKVDASIRMPHNKEMLPVTDVQLLEKWIDQGAKND